MTAKEYLRQLWRLDREVEIKYQVLEQTRAGIGIRALPDPNQHVGSSGETSDPVSSTVMQIMKMEKYLDQRIDKYINLKATIIEQIENIKGRSELERQTYRNILTCRYVLYMKDWEKIGESVGYSRSQVIHLHGKALQVFEDQYLKSKYRTESD